MFPQFRNEIVRYRNNVLEYEQQRIESITAWTMAMEGIGKMLEESQEICNAFDFTSYFWVIRKFGLGGIDDSSSCHRVLLFFVFIHLS